MGLVLGVEGDGAHTHAVLTDSSGSLLGLGANDDSSDWDSVGIAAAAAALRSCITEALSSGGEVSFTGFGKFHVAERGPRQGVNPRTGERITIPGGKVPRFSAGSALKAKVKG